MQKALSNLQLVSFVAGFESIYELLTYDKANKQDWSCSLPVEVLRYPYTLAKKIELNILSTLPGPMTY